jgi:hypothetical protein
MKAEDFGKKFPIPTPINMAKKIHNVRNLSKNPNFFRLTKGVQLDTDIKFI